MNEKIYLIPKNIEQCLDLLKKYDGEAVIIAGGTDLMLSLKEKKISKKAIIDITEIPELKKLQFTDDTLNIGASITHAQIAKNIWIGDHMQALAEACNSIGSPQIRNIATLVGNIVNAQPAADSAIALVAMDAKVEVISDSRVYLESVENLYKGVGKSKINSCKELVTKIIIDLPVYGSGTAFRRISKREALSLPVLNVSIFITIIKGKVKNVRIAIGPVAKHPFRPVKAEQILIGKQYDDSKAFKEAALMASTEANPRNSIFRGSKEYRSVLIKFLVYDTLKVAIKNAMREDVR